MNIKSTGCLGSQLYRLGWQNALHRNRALMAHRLLSIFLYYRRGFNAGSEFVNEYRTEKNLR